VQHHPRKIDLTHMLPASLGYLLIFVIAEERPAQHTPVPLPDTLITRLKVPYSPLG
jgi:hypothetical protein